jgi:hypothetical protein
MTPLRCPGLLPSSPRKNFLPYFEKPARSAKPVNAQVTGSEIKAENRIAFYRDDAWRALSGSNAQQETTWRQDGRGKRGTGESRYEEGTIGDRRNSTDRMAR